MNDLVRVVAPSGLRLRDSPRDGITLEVLPPGAELKVLSREIWLRVLHGGQEGFVLADFVEPVDPGASPVQNLASQESPITSASQLTAASVAIVDYPAADWLSGAQLRIDEAFSHCVDEIGTYARKNGVIVWVTSSFREPYVPVANAKVAPAALSNHLVGHALDMNIVYAGVLYGSAAFQDCASLPPPVYGFLTDVSSSPNLRWGGDFVTPDYVHIDDGLNIRAPRVYAAKLDALWGASSPGTLTA